MQATTDAVKVTPEMRHLLETNPAVRAEVGYYARTYGEASGWAYLRVCAHPAEESKGGKFKGLRDPQQKIAKEISDAMILDLMESGTWYSTKDLGHLLRFDYQRLIYLLASLSERGFIDKRRVKGKSQEWIKIDNPVFCRDEVIKRLSAIDREMYDLVASHPYQTSHFYAEKLKESNPDQVSSVLYGQAKARLARLRTRRLIDGVKDPNCTVRGGKAKLWHVI